MFYIENVHKLSKMLKYNTIVTNNKPARFQVLVLPDRCSGDALPFYNLYYILIDLHTFA